MLNTSFKTLVTEHGVGIQAKTQLALRVVMEEAQPQQFSGIGFGLDALLARLASEGEAIERSTWHYGALWNSASLTQAKVFLPEETTLLFSKEEQEELCSSPSLVYRAKNANREMLSIPSQALFFFPKRKQFGEQHAVTTGWAFHGTKKEALAQGYREVIERDLQMLFWHNRLSKQLQLLPKETTEAWLKAYGGSSSDHSKLFLLQMPLHLHPTIHHEGYFTLAIQISDEAPFLTIGSAVKESAHASFQTAIGEMIMLRAYQYEMMLTEIKETNEFSYQSHVSHATYETTAREKIKELIASLNSEPLKPLDYSQHDYQVVYLNPPPQTREGAVAKVWVENTQGMVPAGFEYGVCHHWQEVWGMTPSEWQANLWHPYP